MSRINKTLTEKKQRPIKILQYGEGNFLRAFVDYFVDIANEQEVFDGDIVLVKPIEFGKLDRFYEQDCQYTVSLRGVKDHEAKVENRIVTCVASIVDPYVEYQRYAEYSKLDTLRFIVSNTTEAGIVFEDTDEFEQNPPRTYPGKLTKFLYERYLHFHGEMDKGLIMLPVELIDDNGIQLKKCVLDYAGLWKLEAGFINWLNTACVFTSTLVDRIVTGYPREDAEQIFKDLGYEDQLLVTAEPFGLWVIESEKDITEEFPLPKAGLPVIFTDNQKPYKQRKVRILNGAHTSFVLASYLAGNDFVLESMQDELIRNFMEHTIFDEVIPTLTLPKEELIQFAKEVTLRFQNPYVKHALLSISLNSVSKWKARCMPSYQEYRKQFGKFPQHLTFSIAALMAFYTGTEIRGKALIGSRNGNEYEILDDQDVLEFFAQNSWKSPEEYTEAVLSNTEFWGCDLSEKAACKQVTEYLLRIREYGMREALGHWFPVKSPKEQAECQI